jgi:hypothetical protein
MFYALNTFKMRLKCGKAVLAPSRLGIPHGYMDEDRRRQQNAGDKHCNRQKSAVGYIGAL